MLLDDNKKKMIPLKIFDETLRDGEQQVGVNFSVSEKKELANVMTSSGVDYIDLMLGVHPTEDGLIGSLAQQSVPIVPACMMDRRYVDKAVDLGVKKVIMFYCVSDILLNARNKTRDDVVTLSKNLISYAREKGLEVDFAAEDSTRADFDYLAQVGRELKPFIDYFMICDTVGCLQPTWSFKLVRDFIEETGCKVGVHYHNDLGLAVENTIQGVLGGASLISGTFTGIGERAGNVPLELVLTQLKEKHGIKGENLDYGKIPGICSLVTKYAKIAPAKPLSEEAFYTETGIHVDALMKDSRSYSIFPDIEPEIWFGKYSGASNFRWLYERILNMPLKPEKYAELRDSVKELAMKNQRSYSWRETHRLFSSMKITKHRKRDLSKAHEKI